MRIGLVAPPWVAVPPPSYGGTETVIDNLARSFVESGHDVRLFTVGTSTCPVRTAHVFPAPADTMGATLPEAVHVLAAYAALDDVDVIHDHTLLGPLLGKAALRQCPPVVVTHHGVFDDDTRRVFTEVSRHADVVSISHDQASRALEVPVCAVVHHGIDTDVYRPAPGSRDGDYLLFVGRMSASKGPDRAIAVARRSRRHLVALVKMREAAEIAYFEKNVAPMLDDDVTLLFEPDIDTRLDLQRGAAALVNPIAWPEPFGLVMVEALATGTPVITGATGAAAEIVANGRTGWLCTDEDDFVAAIGRLGEIDPAECRREAVTRFDRRRMAADYLTVFDRILADRRAAPCAPHGSALISAHPMTGRRPATRHGIGTRAG